MVPQDVASEITQAFPRVKMLSSETHDSTGFGVEFKLDGEIMRMAWIVRGEPDWKEIKDKAMTWLTYHYRS